MLFAAMPVVAGDYEYGLAAYQARDYQKAFRLLKPLAEQGHATAQSNPGMMYDKGDGVPQDAAKALFWLTRAAEQGDAAGQYDLGSLYEYGDGVSRRIPPRPSTGTLRPLGRALRMRVTPWCYICGRLESSP